ncbi:MAG TPA: hypothetical protein VKU36_05485, partial [Candidatus Babeliales bacterium]|nr:hypothetical protein [Candidatus Babeliales bacterium]
IKIGDSQARLTHNFLEANNKDKQKTFANLIEKNDKDFIEETNKHLAEIKATLNTLIQKVQAHHNSYIEQKNTLIKEKSTDIRNTKQGLTHTHQLNQTFKLHKDSYCSDDEEKSKEEDYYSNEYILKKIGIDYASNQTKEKTDSLLSRLQSINTDLQTIQSLKTEHFDK